MRAEITTKTVLHRIPGMEAVTVRRKIAYRVGEAGTQTMDLYYPPHQDATNETPRPAVVIVLGFPDVGVRLPLGCQFRDMGMAVS